MTDLYAAAKQRLAQIAEEERQLREYIRAHDRTLKLLSLSPQGSLFEPGSEFLVLDLSASTEPRVVRPEPSAPERRTRVTGNPKPATVVQASISILRDCGRPMSRRELHTALAERGLIVQGHNPTKALGTMLWRGRDQLVQLDGFGYWPKADAYPAANYEGVR